MDVNSDCCFFLIEYIDSLIALNTLSALSVLHWRNVDMRSGVPFVTDQAWLIRRSIRDWSGVSDQAQLFQCSYLWLFRCNCSGVIVQDWLLTCWCVWTIIVITCAWSIIFDSRDPWARECEWTITFIYSWSVTTRDQSCVCAREQRWRLINVNYIKLLLINQNCVRLNNVDQKPLLTSHGCLLYTSDAADE